MILPGPMARVPGATRTVATVLVLCLGSLLGFQLVQERVSGYLVARVVASQRQRAAWNVSRLDATLLQAEASISRFAALLSEQTSVPVVADVPLESLVRRDADGSWRTPRAAFRPAMDGGIWIPPGVPLTAENRLFFTRALTVTRQFGLGAEDSLLMNTWVLPLTNGEVIFWPGNGDFIANTTSDLDYRSTPWVQLTNPRTNPLGRPRWTEPDYDPAARQWLISVVAPFQIQGRWAGSVGHDMGVASLLQKLSDGDDTTVGLPPEGSSTMAAVPLFVARADGQLLARQGAIPQKGELLPSPYKQLLPTGKDADRGGIAVVRQGDNYIIRAPIPTLASHAFYVVPGAWIRRSLRDELTGLQMAEILFLLVLAGSALAVVLRDAQHRHQRQTLLETRNRDLEVEVQQRTQALSQAHERLKQEVLMASGIQRDLLVGERELHRLTPGLEVGVLMIPSKEVGGDLYDCIAVGGGRYCFCVGDVAGKGMPAALLMSTCLSLMRSYAEILDSPAAITRRLNQRLCHNNEACAFTTLVVGSLDTQSGELRWCNAGHVPLLLQRPDGSVTLLSTVHGPALGVVEGANYGEGRLSLEPGSIVLGFTDGASEMASGASGRFGIARVVDFMEEVASTGPVAAPTPPRLVRALMRRLREFAAGVAQQDDITLLALRLKSPTPDRQATQVKNGHNMETMEPPASLHLPIGNAVAAMAGAKEAIGAYCQAQAIGRPLQRRLLVVIDELLHNTIHHGCRSLGDQARISIDLQRRGDILELVLRDNGAPPFNPLKADPPDLEGPLEDRAIGGLGIHLVRRLCSSVDYDYINGFNETRVQFPLNQVQTPSG